MNDATTLYADVLLPLAIPNYYSYRVPRDWNNLVMPGQRVMVQFGKNRLYTALVVKLHTDHPGNYETKYILDILDKAPVVTPLQLKFWEWMAEYYMCNCGEVMTAAVPAGFRYKSKTIIMKNDDFEGDAAIIDTLSLNEYKIMKALEDTEELRVESIASELKIKNVTTVINNLKAKGLLCIKETSEETYKPKSIPYIRLTPGIDQEQLKEIMNSLEKKAFKQIEVLMSWLFLSKWGTSHVREVSKKELLTHSKSEAQTLNKLIEKKIVEVYLKDHSRIETKTERTIPLNILTKEQEEAFIKIKKSDKNVILLHGVTSSGKTEIYMHLMQGYIQQNKSVLYMVPEIGLTAQLIQRLKKRWGDMVGVYHSRYSANERVEIWNAVRNPVNKGYSIILGTRSSLFLPFKDLGLIIIDEEHDYSFKQNDPAPRYNGRDSAIYLASKYNAKVVLGSATPSLESYYNAANGKYELVELFNRFGDMELPEIDIYDMHDAKRKKKSSSIFSPLLVSTIENALKYKEQVIVFRNLRGYSKYLECSVCAHVPHCIRCDVSLTYHKKADMLRCHYCGYSIAAPLTCPACGSPALQMKGEGTERLEEELYTYFPSASIERMDLDSTRGKHAFTNIINRFEDRQIDILVGTQMITKGLDFNNVSVVGIVDADAGLNFPDFRAPERSFQLMTQVSGRSGRMYKRGKVIIQTGNPQNAIIQQVLNNDYKGMYKQQIEERFRFSYPPFVRLIVISLSHKLPEELEILAQQMASGLKERFSGKRVFGPESPLISRIQNYFIKNILLKIERDNYSSKTKRLVSETINGIYKKYPEFNKARIKIDIDPY